MGQDMLFMEWVFLFCKNHVSIGYLFLFFFFFLLLMIILDLFSLPFKVLPWGWPFLMKYISVWLCHGRPALTKLQYPTGEVVEICVSPFQVPEMQGRSPDKTSSQITHGAYLSSLHRPSRILSKINSFCPQYVCVPRWNHAKQIQFTMFMTVNVTHDIFTF